MTSEIIYRLEELFQYILSISLRASLLVLLAYAVRRAARGLRGKYLCIIWMSVFLAFLCPVSVGIPVQIPWETAKRAEQFIESVVRTAAGDLQTEQTEKSESSESSPINAFLPEMQGGSFAFDSMQGEAGSIFDSMQGEPGLVVDAMQIKSGSAFDNTQSICPSATQSGIGLTFDDIQWTGWDVDFDETDLHSGEMHSKSDSFLSGSRSGFALAFTAAVWLLAAGGLIIWQLSRYLSIKRRLRVAVKYKDGIYITDQIESPILFGYIHPQIYLPPGLENGVLDYAVLHERMHLRRRDYLCKLAAFLICAIYWWNPLVWLMYRSFEADMERACDEAVLEVSGVPKHIYARALLELECRRSSISCALGFGGSSAQVRIKNILNFQQTGTARRRISALTVVVFVIASLVQFRSGAFEGSGSLTLAVCDSQEKWLLPVIEKYKELYPGVALEMEVYSDFVPTAYQLQTVSESGAKPDLLLGTNQGLDNLEELMQEGVYAPLDEFMASEEGWTKSDYVMPVIDSGKYEGTQYVMPLSYNMLFAVTSKEVMEKNNITREKCSDIAAFVGALAGLYDTDYSQRILADVGGLSYFPQILRNGYGDGETGNALEQTCEAYGKLYEEELASSCYSYGEEYYSVGQAITVGDTYFYFPRTLEAGLQAAAGIAAADTPCILPVRNLQEQTVAVATSYAGIRQGSENKQNAWNFLRLLLDEDSQYALSEQGGSCSVNREVLKKCMEKYAYGENSGMAGLRIAADGVNDVRKRAEAVFLQDCLEFVSQPQLCIWRDNAGMMEFQSAMEPFYDGERTYEECISKITV